jgi:hypothetical protein
MFFFMSIGPLANEPSRFRAMRVRAKAFTDSDKIAHEVSLASVAKLAYIVSS